MDHRAYSMNKGNIGKSLDLDELLRQANEALHSEDWGRTIGIAEQLVERNVPRAWTMLGSCYEHSPEPYGSFERAMDCYREAKASGDEEGALAVARFYMTGKGVTQDYEMAYRMYEDIAQQTGSPRALYAIGWMHLNGQGRPVNIPAAEDYLRRASRGGHCVAPRVLCVIHWRKRRWLAAAAWYTFGVVRSVRTALFSRDKSLLIRPT